MPLTAGQRVGPYEILAPLGIGGMGEVYRARDTRLNRDVAVKVLPASMVQDASRLQRFELEAPATSALNHPNILTVHDIGTATLEDERAPFIVSELLDGEDLRAQLANGALSLRTAIEYAIQIASGLAAAHEKGIVHRDLKPENLFITRDGRVKILDFGLAKLETHDASAHDAATRGPVTDVGVVMGTVGYMSPEQVRGQAADHRSDIFSFGAVLYELVSGRRAFACETGPETLTAILKQEPPDVSTIGTPIPPSLERLVRRCVEKNAERRFQSAHDLVFALGMVHSPSALAPPTSGTTSAATSSGGLGKRERIAWLAATTLAALLAVGLAATMFSRPAAQPNPPRVVTSSLLPPANTSLSSIAISPDGRWLAFGAVAGGKTQLWVRPLESATATVLSGSEGATMPFWSADSRFIGFAANGKLKRIGVSGGAPQTLCDTGVFFGGAWNRDGVIVFSTAGFGLFRVPATGGEPTGSFHTSPRTFSRHRFFPTVNAFSTRCSALDRTSTACSSAHSPAH